MSTRLPVSGLSAVAAFVTCVGLVSSGHAALVNTTITTEDGTMGADAVARSDNNNRGTATEFYAKHDTDRAWIRFDLGSLDVSLVQSAKLELTNSRDITNTYTYTFSIYGIDDGLSDGYETGRLGESWGETAITWNNAPANKAGSGASGIDTSYATLVSSYAYATPKAVGDAVVVAEGGDLVDFIKADTNGHVSFAISRDYVSSTTTAFAAKEHSTLAPPTLTLGLVPEPSGLALLAAGAVAGLRRRRR